MLGNVGDQARWERVLRAVQHGGTQMLNGYIRVDGGEDTIVVSRQSDWCVLYRGKVPLGGADLLAPEIVEKLKGKPDPTKCLLCTNAAVEKEYCEYCSIVVTEHDTCAVCLDEERKEAVWGQLECGHVFHYECAKAALSAAKRCPLCRHPGGKMSIY